MYYFDSRSFSAPVRKRLTKLMRNVAKLQKKTAGVSYVRVFKRGTDAQEKRENKYRPTKPAGGETQTALLLRQSLDNAYEFLTRLLDPVVTFQREHEAILAAIFSQANAALRLARTYVKAHDDQQEIGDAGGANWGQTMAPELGTFQLNIRVPAKDADGQQVTAGFTISSGLDFLKALVPDVDLRTAAEQDVDTAAQVAAARAEFDKNQAVCDSPTVTATGPASTAS